MKKFAMVLAMLLLCTMTFTCLAESSATYTAPGFAAHGDVVTATATMDDNGALTALSINEYYGIRSVGRIVNNLTKSGEDELAMVNAIPECDKVLSEDGKYVSYKYLMIGGKIFECQNAGTNLYTEIGEGAMIEDLQAYLLENTDWWCNAMATAADTGAVLKVADDGEEIVCEFGGVKLSKMAALHSFYGGLTKKEGYTKNFCSAGTTDAWAQSVEVLVAKIMADGGVSDELVQASAGETTAVFLDAVTGATFGYPAIYVNAARQAIENAKAN